MGMDRRSFLAASLALIAARPSPAARSGPSDRPAPKTRWKVRSSEGFDAIAFLGPLSGGELYTSHYRAEVAAFAPRLSPAVRSDIPRLWEAAGRENFGLLGPTLSVLFSGGNDATLEVLLAALEAPESRLLPGYRASPYWDEGQWKWFLGAAPRLRAVFRGMRSAGFSRFRRERAGPDLSSRIGELQRGLAGVDVIAWQERLTGRTFQPTIEIVVLLFCKPHGIKVQGQTFLQASDYGIPTTVRIAAHEMLHPPLPMDGEAARAALSVLGKDPLITRIVRDHDPRWGYTSLDGVLDEDLCQALDQMISEGLGVARNPADRWRASDDGMHVLAGALYGLLREDRWQENGGSIEAWLTEAVRRGRLAPGSLHASAARVLERPVDALWPLRPEGAPFAGGRPDAGQ